MANMLLIPGPVELTDDIKLAQGRAMINHRSTEFGALQAEITQNLIKLFNSQEAYVITGSGTAAIESIIASVVKPEDRMLCLTNGFFGERLCATAKIYCKVVEEKRQWGTGFSIERAKDVIDNSDANVLGMVYNDTSTGVANHIRDVCLYAKKNGMYTLIDAVSAWGGHPLDVNRWGIDALATGSQKCLGAPPGLSMVALSADGVGRIESNTPRAYYLDLKKYREYGKKGETPFTPALSIYYALRVALENAVAEGLENRILRHKTAAEYVRKNLENLGLELFAEEGFRSNTLTPFKTNKADAVKSELKKHGIIIAGGQGELKGKILRVAHLGNFSMERYEIFFSALERILRRV